MTGILRGLQPDTVRRRVGLNIIEMKESGSKIDMINS